MPVKTIGIFIPQVHKSGRGEALQLLADRARERGYHTVCFSSYTDLYRGDNVDMGERSVYFLAEQMEFCAMVVYNELIKDDEVNDMLFRRGRELGIPVFTIDRRQEGTYYIDYSYGKSFEMVVDHVIEKHSAKNIYMMSGQRDNSFSIDREKAYRHSLEKHGIAFDESKIYYGGFWGIPTFGATEELLANAGDELPDAIVCANDMMAIAVCNILEKHGIAVPGQVIVTGLDGIERSRTYFPTISTARPDYDSSVRYIVDVIAGIEAGQPMEPCEKSFGFIRVDGQSCGCEAITGSSGGLRNSALHEIIERNAAYTAINDTMVLRNTDGRDILSVLASVEKYFCEVLYSGIELYLDPNYFGNPKGLTCKRVLAARLAPEPLPNKNAEDYSVPFEPVPDDVICSRDMIENDASVLLVPVHCQERVYGYVATEYRCGDSFGGNRVYDFVTHLNLLLSSVEATTKLSEVIEQLNALYVRDQLTDLLNRHGFYRELEKLIARGESEGKKLTFISADLDGLKYINDNYGHSEGDYAIVAIARILCETAGESGVCARFGGDEYLAACITDETPEQISEHFRRLLADIAETAGKPYPINASFGIEVASPEEARDSIEEIIRRADNKMFSQKRNSKLSRDLKLAAQGFTEFRPKKS